MKIANRYEIIKEIGKGGMANVYLAFDTILNRDVAIKVLKGDMADDPVALERFKREANTSTKLSHPNAVDVYDVGDDNGNHYIVMEYVKGHTLKQLIKRRGALPPKEAVWIMKQLAGALLEAHKNGIIHRDIKSQNVLIKDDGTVKLADFGIAVLNNSMQLTSRGSVLGSVHYLAPELAKGGNATMQSDIYSLGIVFYELLTGDVPYKADTPIQVALLHVRNNVPSVRKFNPDIPQSVENIIIKATARSLEDRYRNIALFIKDLNSCFSKENINEPKTVLTKSDSTTYKNNVPNINDNNAQRKIKKEKEQKQEKIFNIVFITVLTIISIVAILIILYLTGIIGGNDSKIVTVPDIKGQTVTEAKDMLASLGLSIDDYDIEWTITDSTPENQIVSFTPEFGTSVEKGSKIKIVVSEGNYLIMSDYVGMDIEEAKRILSSKNFSVKATPVESDKPVGTIIGQSGLVSGDKYNPDVANSVELTYSKEDSMQIIGFIGRNLDDVYNELTSLGFNVETILLDYDSLSEVEKSYAARSVCRIDPIEGSLYIQEEENSIKLYYYE